jgi:PAS domain S-box-containing protein
MQNQPDPTTTDLAIEARFRDVVERLPAIVYLEEIGGPQDAPGSLLYVSPQVEAILGFTPREWMADPIAWSRQLHPDDVEAARSEYQRAVATGEPFVAEYRMFARDGRVLWFRDEAIIVRNEIGAPVYWQGIMYEVTAQHEAEARYRTLVETLPAIVYTENVTGSGLQMVYVNSRVEQILGISTQRWIEDPDIWLATMHPEDRDRVAASDRESEAAGGPFSVEYRMLAADGHVVWFRDEAILVYGPDGTPSHWQGVMMDISALKAAESQLAETEARYRALVEQMPTIAYVDPLEGSVSTIYISPQTTAILGYTPQDWYDDPDLWSKIVHPDDAQRALVEGLEPHDSTYRLIARDGRVVWIHDQARVIRDEAGVPKFWQGVLVDITYQRRAEDLERDLAAERASSELLREADELKNTFLRAVSHDLRTPLAAILGLAATLERPELDLPPEEGRELAGRIVANARRLDRMVTDMLDLDRLARGAIVPVLAPVDVGNLVRELVANSDLVAGRRLHLDTAPISIRADAAMLERIVENLLGNTAKHTPGDSRIWVRVERVEAGVQIAVEDDGPGIPHQDRERIFQAFAQGPTPARSTGVGVGLAVVARFAELHGGRAWVTEREGGGASFRVLLAEAPALDPAVADQGGLESAPSEASQA